MVLVLAALYTYRQYQKEQEALNLKRRLQLAMTSGEVLSGSIRNAWSRAVLRREDTQTTEHAVIQPDDNSTTKLGLTLHRLAIGLYVYNVDPASEAAYAGVLPGSILVACQTVPLLAEASKRALHRVWQYESQQESPIVLTLLLDEKEYSVILLQSPWGISWAPCGNFALVQRSYALAAEAKVPKGTLLIQINESDDIPDHAQAADQLQKLMDDRQEIRLVCAYPSATLRSQDKPDPTKKKIQMSDGIEIKWHRLEYALCQTNTTALQVDPLEELLDQVSAGAIASPTENIPALPYRYNSLPDPTSLLSHWNALDSFVMCLRLDTNNYEWQDDDNITTSIEELRSFSQYPRAPHIIDRFLLPAVSIICSPGEEANEVTAVLLKLSRRDEGLCQRLYFVLRSYIATLEQGDGNKNLEALLHCLELLRFAEKDMATRTTIEITPVKKKSSSASSASPESPMPSSPPKSKKKKGFLKFIKRKGKEGSLSPTSKTNKQIESRSKGENSTGNVRVQLAQSPAAMYENMSDFLGELDRICETIERTLQKSFREKIAEWALQPWSPSKDAAITEVTNEMRSSLMAAHEKNPRMLVNPVESSEILSSLDYSECYVLPSAHFPLLLNFNMSETRSSDSMEGEQLLYQTSIEILSVQGAKTDDSKSYVVHAAVAGDIKKTTPTAIYSTDTNSSHWTHGNEVEFTTRSSWGAPNTISFRLSCLKEEEEDGVKCVKGEEIGFGWINVSEHWDFVERNETSAVATCRAEIVPCDAGDELFDEHGMMQAVFEKQITIAVKINMKLLPIYNSEHSYCRKRSLLYKHGDDIRQEAFAVQFIRVCDKMLKSCGLDMKLLTFQCMPVGARRGFVEWVPGSIPLSEICQPFAATGIEEGSPRESIGQSPSMFAKAGLIRYGSLRRLTSYSEASIRKLSKKAVDRGSFANNPVQDYLRSIAFDVHAPYLIDRDVMDTYVKSCAGYCVITYILGVGDRHLDNILLSQTGCLFHCDFSFLLGNDPKKYLPMRITDDMIFGMGGKGSDNYVKFLSLVGAAYLALRRPEASRVLLSMIRTMEPALIPDISITQTTEQALLGVRSRLRLELSEQDAVGHIEKVIEENLSSKMWMAVDAIHSLGKQF